MAYILGEKMQYFVFDAIIKLSKMSLTSAVGYSDWVQTYIAGPDEGVSNMNGIK